MLIAADLLVDPLTGKERTLYSLRHTYATMRLLYGKNVTWELLEQQMDTSSPCRRSITFTSCHSKMLTGLLIDVRLLGVEDCLRPSDHRSFSIALK